MLFHGQNKQLFCNEKRIADPDGNFDHLQGFLSSTVCGSVDSGQSS